MVGIDDAQSPGAGPEEVRAPDERPPDGLGAVEADDQGDGQGRLDGAGIWGARDESAVRQRGSERGTLIAAQLLGLALCRYILRFEPLASLPADDVVAAIAPSVQRYLARPAASPPARRG